MNYSASEAAKAVGVSIPTITRAIKKGKLSATPNGSGGYLIDPSELFRAFPKVTSKTNVTPPMLGIETPNVTSALEVEIKVLREMVDLQKDTISDLRKRLDQEAEDRRRIPLLSHTTLEASENADLEPLQGKKRRWWPFGSSKA